MLTYKFPSWSLLASFGIWNRPLQFLHVAVLIRRSTNQLKKEIKTLFLVLTFVYCGTVPNQIIRFSLNPVANKLCLCLLESIKFKLIENYVPYFIHSLSNLTHKSHSIYPFLFPSLLRPQDFIISKTSHFLIYFFSFFLCTKWMAWWRVIQIESTSTAHLTIKG